ncbi:uncharacterized protein Dvar_26930 [Desulfosarcina variabilis str. Montpellier]|uniref:hypothetical protein n=1 Tax=Desulfosarcina variabilis TaxID=2300 RepID=UPI003AFA4284
MPEAKFGTALDKVRQRRRFLFELIVFAFFFAICVNFFSTALLELMRPDAQNTGFWVWNLVISGGVLLVVVLVAFQIAFFKTAHEETAIGITLPLRVDTIQKTVSVELLADYEPADRAKKAFEFKKSEAIPVFFKDWPLCKNISQKDFGPDNVCWNLLAELIEALLVIMLREFGKRSLTHKAMYYSVFRRFAGKIPNRQLNSNEWPTRLKANRFLKGQKIKQILLPDWIHLETPLPLARPKGKPLSRELRLTTKNGSLTFYTIPYWTTLRDPFKIANQFHIEKAEQVCFLRIVVVVRQELRGGLHAGKNLFFNDTEMTLQYLWFQSLVRTAFLHMDWGRYLRGEGSPDEEV